MPAEALQVDVEVHRGAFHLALRLEAPPGVTVLFGPSGSGKTTALRIVAGLEAPSAGAVRLGATPWVDTTAGLCLPPERRAVGMVFQSLALFPHLTARENVAFGSPGDVDAWLTRFRVAHVAHRKPPTLSGGEAQRVALARAFARQPRVLLLDEPFASLDEALRDALLREVAAVVEAQALPTLFVTHSRHEAELLGGGRLVTLGGRP